MITVDKDGINIQWVKLGNEPTLESIGMVMEMVAKDGTIIDTYPKK